MKLEKCVCGGDGFNGVGATFCLEMWCRVRTQGKTMKQSAIMWNAAMKALKRKKVKRAK